MTQKNLATWSLTLDTECPHCKKDVDLMDFPDLWDGNRFTACEHNTPATTDVLVVCPECGEEFEVDFQY